MRIPPGRRSLQATHRSAIDPARPRTRRAVLSRVEVLETRALLATAGHALPSPPEALQTTVQTSAPPPVAPASNPQVAFVQFQPLTGRVLVVYSGDLAGYSTATLTNPANYSFQVVKTEMKLPPPGQSRPKAGVVLAPTFKVTGVTLSTPVAPGMPQTVLVTINNNQPIRSGTYQFTIKSPGITDLAGRPLDGQFTGTFPSGGSQPGGDFVANLVLTHNTVLPAQTVTPPPTPGRPPAVVPGFVFFPALSELNVRYAAAKPGKFMLAGGNNITLIPLSGQFFPGTFRPASTKPK